MRCSAPVAIAALCFSVASNSPVGHPHASRFLHLVRLQRVSGRKDPTFS